MGSPHKLNVINPGLDKGQRGAFLGALIGWVFDYYEVFLMTMLAIPITKEFGLSTEQTGLIFSIQLLFLAIGGVFWGYLADRIGRKKVLMATIIIFSLWTILRGCAPDYVMLLLAVITAFGIGGEYGVGQTLVSETVPSNSRGWYSGLLYGGIYIGILAGAVVGGYFAPVIGWRWTLVVSGLPALFALWVRRNTLESAVWLERSADARKNAFERVKMTRGDISAWLLCFCCASLQFFAYYGLASFLPTYMVQQGSTIAGASLWLVFTAVAGGIGCLIGAFLCDRIGRRATLSALAGSACIGGVVLGLFWTHLLAGTWILIPFFVLFAGSNGAAVFGALFSELFRAELRATAVSSAIQLGRGVSFFPPLAAAALLPIFGYRPIIFISAGLFGVLAIVAWAFRETRRLDLARHASVEDRWAGRSEELFE